MAQEKLVTPEFLTEIGFVELAEDNTPPGFDIIFDTETQKCFIENQVNRNAFCMVLEYMEDHWDCLLYVQDDIGCGFLLMPDRWSGMPIDRLNDFYSAFMGVKLF